MDLPAASRLAQLSVDERNKRLLEAIENGCFDFLDLGTHKGAGIDVGIGRFNGRRGLGVELEERKATAAMRNGYYVYCADILGMPVSESVFRFAMCRHVLEHMPNEYVLGAVLWKISQLCSDFLFIEQPNFDDHEYLAERGLTLRQYLATYHTCQITTGDLAQILSSIGVRHFLIGGTKPLHSSEHPEVHALGSPPDSPLWTDDSPSKPRVTFDRPVFGNIAVIAALKSNPDLQALASTVKGLEIWTEA